MTVFCCRPNVDDSNSRRWLNCGHQKCEWWKWWNDENVGRMFTLVNSAIFRKYCVGQISPFLVTVCALHWCAMPPSVIQLLIAIAATLLTKGYKQCIAVARNTNKFATNSSTHMAGTLTAGKTKSTVIKWEDNNSKSNKILMLLI